VLRALGIRVTRRGTFPVFTTARGTGRPAPRGTLVVANHVSWLDIVVFLAISQPGAARPGRGRGAGPRVRLVAKSEVRDWPVIGQVARYTGTIFLDRSRPRALPGAVDQARAALAAGDVVAVFPEGTTSCGRATGPFRPAFFQAALDAGVPVTPVTLRFRGPDGRPGTEAAFLGEETLVASLRRILAARGLRIDLACAAALHPDPAASRRILAQVAQRAVGAPDPERPAWAPIPPPAAPYLVGDQRIPADSRTTPVALRPAA
jgi:1-acyl-sn-glycerol-3-phosphate acyltransferase